MKTWILIGLILVASMDTKLQGKLHSVKNEYIKLLDDVRHIARVAASQNLYDIREKLDYYRSGRPFLLNNNNY